MICTCRGTSTTKAAGRVSDRVGNLAIPACTNRLPDGLGGLTAPGAIRLREVHPPPRSPQVLGEELQRALLRQLIVRLAEAAALVAAEAVLGAHIDVDL